MYNALIRTHHITSRKKVATLKAAAKRLNCYVLIRSGGIPGVMYVEGPESQPVQQWVDIVRGLRYKDYQLAAPVASASKIRTDGGSAIGILEEVENVKDLASVMDRKGLLLWWRAAMGFTHE